jgi:predicted nucleic acid-binding protein
MKKIVLDSCVFIKMFLDEEDSDLALEFFNKLLEERTKIIVPHLFKYEVFAIAQKNKISLENIAAILENYEKVAIRYEELDSQILPKIISITKEGNIKSGFPSFYDSSYHALAIINECNFITCDKKHYKKTKQLKHIKLLQEFL